MLRSIIFIKSVHTLAFVVLSIANVVVLYAALTGRITTTTWIALGLVLIEGVVLMFNGWRCPLRIYAEKIGAVSGQITDIFLPKWFADRIFLICGGLFACSILLFMIRYFGSFPDPFVP
jgi:hypothetical protein